MVGLFGAVLGLVSGLGRQIRFRSNRSVSNQTSGDPLPSRRCRIVPNRLGSELGKRAIHEKIL